MPDLAMLRPRDGWRGQPGWVLLPLRAFLAVVYLDGAISKVADRRFLAGTSPTSMHASAVDAKVISPIGGLLGPVIHHSFAFGLLIVVAEMAIGLGILLGAFTRIAAAGGMLLAVGLWLTVSFRAQPWFTSADIVYVFALTPLLIAGAGDVLSVDGWLARASQAHAGRGEDGLRRALLGSGMALLGVAVLGLSAAFRRSPASGSGASAAGPSSASGSELTPTTSVPVGGAKQITDPATGDPGYVLQLSAGQFTALDAVCPHQGCAVQFVSAQQGFVCPCHGSTFTASGSRTGGPAPHGLGSIPVTVSGGVVRRA